MWVVVTICHEPDPPHIIVTACGTYERAVRLEESRVESLPAPMWTHHVRNAQDMAEVPA